MILDEQVKFNELLLREENAKKIKTAKKSNLDSFASMCGVDLDNSGKTGSTSIKNEFK